MLRRRRRVLANLHLRARARGTPIIAVCSRFRRRNSAARASANVRAFKICNLTDGISRDMQTPIELDDDFFWLKDGTYVSSPPMKLVHAVKQLGNSSSDDERNFIEPRAPKIRHYLEEKEAAAAAQSSL